MREGWEICKIEDVINLIDYRGRTPVKTKSGVRLITAKNVKLGYLQLDPQEFIAEDNYESWMTRGIPNFGDVIFTTEAPLGNVAQINTKEKLAFAQRIIVMQPNAKKLDQTFLKYMLLSEGVRNSILEKGTGATVQGIKSSLLKKIMIPLPPLSEQQRIVSILDNAFAAIDKAKANAEQNLNNAKELFESVLKNLIKDDGKSKMVKLGDLCEIKGRIGYRGYTVQDLVQKGEGAITLSPSNIRDNKFNTDKCTYISWFKYEESPEIMIFDGDILFVKTGSTYGKVALVENLPEKATINPQFVVLKDIKCMNTFLYYNLTTRAFKEKVENIVGGAATPTLSQTNLANQTIPIPPMKDQQNIVRQLDSLRAETQKLEAIYQQKLFDLEELKKSVLQKAFSGDLPVRQAGLTGREVKV